MQALGTSPLGPFTKVQESNGGVILGVEMTEYGSQAWDHVLCTGSHSFVSDGDDLWVVYHQDKNRLSEGYTGVGQMERGIAIDKVDFVENELGQTILHCNGPTTSLQPKVTSSLEFKNLIPNSNIIAKTTTELDSSTLKDELMKFRSNDKVDEFIADGDLTIEINFDDYITAKSILIYNSSDYYKAFRKIETLDISFRKELEGKECVGTARASNVEYDLGAYSNAETSYVTSTAYMRPGAPLIFEFEELETNKIIITIKCPEGQESIALNEIVVLGKE
jgi:hypothetical protein